MASAASSLSPPSYLQGILFSNTDVCCRLLHRARPQLWASDTAQLSDRPGVLRASWHQPPQVSHHLVTSRAFSFQILMFVADFFIELDHSCGPLTLHSSLTYPTRYLSHGISRLKSLTT